MSGRQPSDALGLYDLISATAEQGEPTVSQFESDHERRLETDEQFLSAATSVFSGSDIFEPMQPLTALVQVHRICADINLQLPRQNGRLVPRVGLAILGAPIWISKPHADSDGGELIVDGMRRRSLETMTVAIEKPSRTSLAALIGEPLDPVTSDRSPAVLQVRVPIPASSWTVFEQQVARHQAVDNRRSAALELLGWPPTPDQWGEFVAWLIHAAVQVGPSLLPLSAPSKRGLDYIRRGRRGRRDIVVGRHGWFVSSAVVSYGRGEESGFLVCEDGSVWPALENGAFLGVRMESDLRQVPPGSVEAAGAMVAAVSRWRRPFRHHEPVSDTEIVGTTVQRVLAERPRPRLRSE